MKQAMLAMTLLMPLLCACGGDPTAPSHSPVATLTMSPEGHAIVGITTLTFDAAADPSGQTTYFWDFGDGVSASGASVRHLYTVEGSFTVVLIARSRGGEATASKTVDVRSLSGWWRPDFLFAPCFTILLTQHGLGVDAVAINGSAASAAVESPRKITISIASAPVQNCGAVQNLSGTFDATLDSFTVTLSPTQFDTWRRR